MTKKQQQQFRGIFGFSFSLYFLSFSDKPWKVVDDSSCTCAGARTKFTSNKTLPCKWCHQSRFLPVWSSVSYSKVFTDYWTKSTTLELYFLLFCRNWIRFYTEYIYCFSPWCPQAAQPRLSLSRWVLWWTALAQTGEMGSAVRPASNTVSETNGEWCFSRDDLWICFLMKDAS